MKTGVGGGGEGVKGEEFSVALTLTAFFRKK